MLHSKALLFTVALLTPFIFLSIYTMKPLLFVNTTSWEIHVTCVSQHTVFSTCIFGTSYILLFIFGASYDWHLLYLAVVILGVGLGSSKQLLN